MFYVSNKMLYLPLRWDVGVRASLTPEPEQLQLAE